MKQSRTKDDYFSRAASKYDTLSINQKKIADYITENVDEVILSSAAKIAGILNISEAAVVRFAQYLGYSGYPDLKRELIRFYRDQMTPNSKFEKYLETLENEKRFYAQIAEQEIDHLKDSIQSVDDESLNRAADHIIGKQHRFIFATAGSNEAIASYLSFRLNRFKLRSTPVLTSGIKLFERFGQLTPDDFVIHYSFYKPLNDHRILMDFLKKRSIPNLLITDSLIPSMVDHADIVLFARRGPFGVFHSLIIPMAITNALIVAVAQKLGVQAIEALEDLSSIRESYAFDGLTSKETFFSSS